MNARMFVTLALFLALGSPSANAGKEERAISGVAKPRITILKPTSMARGGMAGHDMGGQPSGGHDAMGHDMGSAGPATGGVRPEIEDYPLPVKYSTPYGVAADSKGIIWFTEMSNHTVARLDPKTGELKEYRLPSAEGLPDAEWTYDPKSKLTTPQSYDVYSVGNPGAMIVDKNDMIWFVTQLGNSVARFDPAKEEFTEFMIPTKNAQPYDLSADSKGRIWFVEKNGGKMGFVDAQTKKMVEISLDKGANPMGIVVDKDDMVWIGDVTGNFLGRYDHSTKKMKKFPITVPVSQPGQMRFDQAGNLWVCNLHSQQFGVLIPNPGVYSVVPLPGYNAVPQALAPDAKGRIWMVDSMMNQVGYFDSINLKWNLYEIPTANSQPMGVAVDGAGDVWFTQSDRTANRISRLKTAGIQERAVSDAKAELAAQADRDAVAAGGKPASASGGSRVGLIAAVIAVLALAVGGVILARKPRP